jgi:hypothetical protein
MRSPIGSVPPSTIGESKLTPATSVRGTMSPSTTLIHGLYGRAEKYDAALTVSSGKACKAGDSINPGAIMAG